MLTVVTPAQSYDLTVLATVKAELGITDRSEDENLTRWIKQASDVIAKYCNRVFAQETVSETFRLATRESNLLLSRYPVVSIAAVQETGETLAASQQNYFLIISPTHILRQQWPGGKTPSAGSSGGIIALSDYRLPTTNDVVWCMCAVRRRRCSGSPPCSIGASASE